MRRCYSLNQQMAGLRAPCVADRSCLAVKHCVLVWLLLQRLSTAYAQPQQQAVQMNSVSASTAARTYACEPGDNCQEENSPWAALATRSGEFWWWHAIGTQ